MNPYLLYVLPLSTVRAFELQTLLKISLNLPMIYSNDKSHCNSVNLIFSLTKLVSYCTLKVL
jgi:hypothetical protein